MANPFDDPDVKAAASGGDANSGNVYGGGAYDDNSRYVLIYIIHF